MKRSKKPAPRRIYIDTNVLINDCLHRLKLPDLTDPKAGLIAHEALKALPKLRNAHLMIASFTVMQVLSTLSRIRGRGLTKAQVAAQIRRIVRDFTVLDLTEKDLQRALDSFTTGDLEDYVQFEVSKKLRCSHLLTENGGDFKNFDVIVVKTKNYRQIALDLNANK